MERNPHARDGFITSSHTDRYKWRLCVAVKASDTGMSVRDTKDMFSHTLSYTHEQWDKFVQKVRTSVGLDKYSHRLPGCVVGYEQAGLSDREKSSSCLFNHGEWYCFIRGMLDGEFDPPSRK